MKLYGADVCPFVHRARLVLAEKGLAHEYVAIDFRNKPDWYHEVLPTGKVPLLENGPDRVWESAIVCEYLEDSFPQPALLPRDPGAKAAARIWIDWLSQTLVPAYYKLLKAQSEEEKYEHRNGLTEALTKLENDGFQDGPWIHGTELSMVDLMIYPWFERWGVLEHYRNFAVSDQFPKLRAWRQTLEQRESVKSLAEEPSFYIDQYAHYANPTQAVN